MSAVTLLIIILIILAVLAVIMFPEVRELLKGFSRLIVKDAMATPEGAEAMFENKIAEAQERYNQANEAYRKTSGKLSMTKKDLAAKEKELAECEKKCEALVKAKDYKNAELMADKREEILNDITRLKTLVTAFTEATETAKEANDMCEEDLRNLKKEAKDVVENMKVKKTLKEVYEDMDGVYNAKTVDRLLEQVREKNRDLDEIVEGSKAVHDSKLSTRMKRADDEAKKNSSNAYLEDLKRRLN